MLREALRDSRGETLVEALVAIMIVALVASFFPTAVMTAASLSADTEGSAAITASQSREIKVNSAYVELTDENGNPLRVTIDSDGYITDTTAAKTGTEIGKITVNGYVDEATDGEGSSGDKYLYYDYVKSYDVN